MLFRSSWEGETVETVSDFIFLGSKITADGDCSHEIKRYVQFENTFDVLFNFQVVLNLCVSFFVLYIFSVSSFIVGSLSLFDSK